MSDNIQVLPEKVKELRQKTGVGLIECKKALVLFDLNVEKAYRYLQIRSQAVCRRRPDGKQWTEQDYIDHINKEFLK